MTERMTETTRSAIWERDGGLCRRCGHPGEEIHHRRGRGMGGTSLPAHGYARLVLLCGDCHRWVESHRTEAYATGWAVRRSNPDEDEQVPLRLPSGWLWLTADGSAFVTPKP